MTTDKTRLDAAIALATRRHAAQTWGGYPYTEHLRLVAEMVRCHAPLCGLDGAVQDLEIAAWLHDIIEDTDTVETEIREDFGDLVANLVVLVTDEPGATRRERKKATLKKTGASRKAVFLKLCDRLVNVTQAFTNPASRNFLSMYRAEHPEFKAALGHHEGLGSLWSVLDELLDQK